MGGGTISTLATHPIVIEDDEARPCIGPITKHSYPGFSWLTRSEGDFQCIRYTAGAELTRQSYGTCLYQRPHRRTSAAPGCGARISSGVIRDIGRVDECRGNRHLCGRAPGTMTSVPASAEGIMVWLAVGAPDLIPQT